MNDLRPLYDRELLLLGAKRNVVLDLWEVQRYGSDSYGDTDYVSIHGGKSVCATCWPKVESS